MKKIFLIILITGCTRMAKAQNTLRPNLYFQNMNYYNAGAGIYDNTYSRNISFYAKNRFVSKDNDAIWNKPANIYLNYIGKLDKTGFLNLSYVYDGYSFYNRHAVSIGYGRVYKLGKSSQFSLGARGVFNFDKFNWGKIKQITDKPSFGSHITPDLDLGTQLQVGNLTLDASVKNLLKNSVKADGEDVVKNWREIYLNAAYTFKFFNAKLKVSPYLLYFQERNFKLDAGVNLSFFKTVDVAYAIRLLELRSIFAAKVALSRRLQLGASVDHAVLYSDTNADFFIGYKF